MPVLLILLIACGVLGCLEMGQDPLAVKRFGFLFVSVSREAALHVEVATENKAVVVEHVRVLEGCGLLTVLVFTKLAVHGSLLVKERLSNCTRGIND